MNNKIDCAYYYEYHDMGQTIPCCDTYGVGNCHCSDCKKYASENDRVVVIRCKDCAYWMPKHWMKCKVIWEYRHPNDYCSRAERKIEK